MTTFKYASRLFATLLFAATAHTVFAAETNTCPKEFDVTLRQLHSTKTLNVCDFYKKGGPILIVNTASHCGFTKQFKDLEALYQKHRAEGLVVLGFPSNSFNQEEKTEEGVANVCYKNYGVTFPMFETMDVKGDAAHPIFQYLAKNSQAPQWNFNKYLLMNGAVEHFGSKVVPDDPELERKISAGLKPAK